MEIIKYGGDKKEGVSQSPASSSSPIVKYDNAKPVDFVSVKSAFQAMIIAKTMECNEYLSELFKISNPLAKMTLAFALLNPFQAYSLSKTTFGYAWGYGAHIKRYFMATLYRKPAPVKKTWEICYINENSINHLYVAFDWYLKSNSKKKINKNHTVMIMIKPIEASKKEKDYAILKSVPEEQETEFEYNSYTFAYSKSSFEDVVYAPSGEVKKKNHKLLIWTYDCTYETFDNLSQHVINQYAKSKVEDVWVQKIYTHEQIGWKETPLERNKRKFTTVIMKNNKNNQIGDMLKHFNESEDWHVERGIPYKKTFLFYGPPGTGKTSMIKAIANELQRHIHYLNLAVIKNDTELIGLMSRINFKETVLVIEDIDAQGKLVHKRSKEFAQELGQPVSSNPDNSTGTGNTIKPEEKKPEQTVTLSCLLNQLDGINNNHGMVAILTTNFPEILDEALVRDGRVDEKVFFDYVDHEQIYNMFSNFYNGKNEVTLEIIKSRINFDLYKIAPCNVENSMRRQYANSLKALDDLIESMGSKKSFEKFEI